MLVTFAVLLCARGPVRRVVRRPMNRWKTTCEMCMHRLFPFTPCKGRHYDLTWGVTLSWDDNAHEHNTCEPDKCLGLSLNRAHKSLVIGKTCFPVVSLVYHEPNMHVRPYIRCVKQTQDRCCVHCNMQCTMKAAISLRKCCNTATSCFSIVKETVHTCPIL